MHEGKQKFKFVRPERDKKRIYDAQMPKNAKPDPLKNLDDFIYLFFYLFFNLHYFTYLFDFKTVTTQCHFYVDGI